MEARQKELQEICLQDEDLARQLEVNLCLLIYSYLYTHEPVMLYIKTILSFECLKLYLILVWTTLAQHCIHWVYSIYMYWKHAQLSCPSLLTSHNSPSCLFPPLQYHSAGPLPQLSVNHLFSSILRGQRAGHHRCCPRTRDLERLEASQLLLRDQWTYS